MDLISIILIIMVLLFFIFKFCKDNLNNFNNFFLNTKKKDINILKSSKGETRCRNWLEKKFGLEFPRMRPKWLKNPLSNTGILELDCYNEQLKLAVEYNGAQHYKYVKPFHSSPDKLLDQKIRDKIKKKLCEKNGVRLVIVPYNVKNIEEYLNNKLSFSMS